LKVDVIDKNDKQVSLAGQISGINSRYMRQHGIYIDPKKFAADWLKVSGSRVQEDLLWIFINRSGEGFDWLCDLAGGEENLNINIYVPYLGEAFGEYYGTHHISKKPECDKYTSFGGGFLACEILEKALEEFGGCMYRGLSALYLEKDSDGKVTGCVAKRESGYTCRIKASKAVVLATGDASDDEEMLEAFCPIGLRPAKRFPRRGNTGDGQKMAYWAGAILDNPEWAPTLHALGFSGYQFFFLHVNQRGERFMNEDTWMQAKSVRCLMQPGGDYAFSVFDSKWLDEIEARWPLLGGQGMAPLTNLGDKFDRAQLEKSIHGTIHGNSVFGDGGEGDVYVNGGNGFVADTLEELAEKIGVPAENLIRTVRRYNEIVANGDDTDFGKRRELLTSIEKPPFIALKWGPSLLDVFGGALTDARLHVLDTNHDPIPGLYAVGNAAGGMYAVDYPLLLNGNSYGRALAYALQLADSISSRDAELPRRMKLIAAACLAALSVLLCACGVGDPAPETPPQSASPTPTATTTPKPTPPPASAAPTPYDGPLNPLTGLPIDLSLVNARPVAVMLNNRKIAQPQLGVSKADILIEAPVEGGITRMLALYQDIAGVGEIGSVRSARPYYVDIAQGFDAVYIHAGGSADAYTVLITRGVTRLDGVNGKKQDIFYRDAARRRSMGYEHSMLTSGALITKYLPTYDLRLEHESGYSPGLKFEDSYKVSGDSAESVKIAFSSSKTTSFEYRAETGEYLASQHGGEYRDGNDGERVAFSNILLIKTSVGIIKGDPDGCLEIDLIGDGDGFLAIGGRYIPIKWSKASPDSPFSFTREGGKPDSDVTLRAGRTYIGIVSGGMSVEFN
ncbi:MAG: DUF3048 domain-containing protein, partial [Oscillospiraceae bacterium]|nr:DUF3048 domain-containing protein [Oscillospiraceae bacterium]